MARRKHCEQHAQKFHSPDPAARARQMENLSKARGNRFTVPRFEADAQAVADRAAELEAQTLVRDATGNVPPAFQRIALMQSRAEVELDHLAAKAVLTVRDERRRELLERRVDGYLDRLGMSASAVLAYEPTRLKRAAASAMAHRPRQDPEHVKRVLGLLMTSGAFGHTARNYAESTNADGDPELLLFAPAERAAMTGIEAPDDAQAVDVVAHVPEVGQLRAVRGDFDIDAMKAAK
jgi:hypothetical protein